MLSSLLPPYSKEITSVRSFTKADLSADLHGQTRQFDSKPFLTGSSARSTVPDVAQARNQSLPPQIDYENPRNDLLSRFDHRFRPDLKEVAVAAPIGSAS
ncbi:hypothetical protein MRB53_008541 [Persea americana]|uniref:Uncharacterized protein n=1 Tax=Persea americana TaxID=3435 RepID=A0ACC2MME9_PERAE|nr:hypothetical protein MRB53_008541 [Persea americana]|eukprot:TRINITY_DN5660_c8_g1_i1.p1 TRINITY_DN5660_c8_g1~~TRINITY_DN5660_c8_g1_i1.p1  ORF type:complete len:100 (+),score=7.44 TRINITY_DN5660_c8_g1_i1:99-398(+)